MLVMERDGSLRRDVRHDLTATRVQGTRAVAEEVVLHNREVLGPLVEMVLRRLWQDPTFLFGSMADETR